MFRFVFNAIYMGHMHKIVSFTRTDCGSADGSSCASNYDYWSAASLVLPEVVTGLDGLPRYVCPQCGVRYKLLSALRAHARECGKGAQCPICGFVCTQRRNLPAHIATHSNPKFTLDGDLKKRRNPRRKTLQWRM